MLLRVRWVQTDRLPSGWILRALFTMSIIPCHKSGRVGSSLEEPTPLLLLMDIFTMQLWARWIQSGRLAPGWILAIRKLHRNVLASVVGCGAHVIYFD